MARTLGRTTTDHDEIRRWAEARGGQPAEVRRTGSKGQTGIIRLDFPGYAGAESLKPITWDEWFQKFDESGLALVYQEKTSRGQTSNFNKLVSRETATARRRAAGTRAGRAAVVVAAARTRKAAGGTRRAAAKGTRKPAARRAGTRKATARKARR